MRRGAQGSKGPVVLTQPERAAWSGFLGKHSLHTATAGAAGASASPTPCQETEAGSPAGRKRWGSCSAATLCLSQDGHCRPQGEAVPAAYCRLCWEGEASGQGKQLSGSDPLCTAAHASLQGEIRYSEAQRLPRPENRKPPLGQHQTPAAEELGTTKRLGGQHVLRPQLTSVRQASEVLERGSLQPA